MRPRVRPLLVGSVALLVCTGIAAARIPGPEFTATVRLTGSFLLNLVVGALLVGIAPDYSREVVDRVLEEPATAVLVGVAVLVAFVATVSVFALLGPLVVVAFAIALPMVVVGVVGGTLGAVAVGTAVASAFTDATLWHGVVVGALLVAVLNAVPLIGGLVTFLVSSAGVGVVCMRFYGSR